MFYITKFVVISYNNLKTNTETQREKFQGNQNKEVMFCHFRVVGLLNFPKHLMKEKNIKKFYSYL